MDHKLAETLQCADKYTLNELSADERTQFEEHLFDCPICSQQVRDTFTIVENLKDVLREQTEASAQAAKIQRPGFWNGFQDWLRLPSLVPTFVALALAGFLVYQNSNNGAGDMAQVLTPASLVAPVSRGDKPQIQINRKLDLFLVTFNVDSAHPDSFVCNFRDAAGKQILSLKSAPQPTASFNLPVLLPTKNFPAGQYEMMLHPVSEPDSITTYPFAVVVSAQDNK